MDMKLFELDTGIPEPYDDYYIGEMATVVLEPKSNIRIQVNPDRDRMGVPYFKVFNSIKLKKKETKVCRLHFLDSGMEVHDDGYVKWVPNSKEIKQIKSVLDSISEDDESLTYWQLACWLWNKEYSIFNNKIAFSKKEYFQGIYDNDPEFYMHPSYVPSTTPIPDTWE